MESARRVLCAIIALLVCAPEGALSLQLGAAPLARPYIAPRALTPIAQFGGDEPPRGLSRDSEPEEFFKTNMDSMTDAEKLKSPAVYIGLSILILPFIVGVIALAVAK